MRIAMIHHQANLVGLPAAKRVEIRLSLSNLFLVAALLRFLHWYKQRWRGVFQQQCDMPLL